MKDERHHLATLAQKQLWLHHQAFPESSAYHIHGTFALPNTEIDRDELVTVLEILTRRHAALRTVFRSHDGEPVQVILSESRVDLTESEAGDDDALQAHIERFVARPFNLASGPLLRVLYCRHTGPFGATLSWVVHHIVADGLSLAYLAREFLILLRVGPRALPPAPPVAFVDFAKEQANRSVDEAREYWRSLLTDPPARLPLPRTHTASEYSDVRTSGYALDIPVQLAHRLKTLAATLGVTTFAVLLAAFFALLGKISREADILIGIPVAGRNQASARRTVGFFANTALMRMRIPPGGGFTQLLQAVAEQLQVLLRHQNYPFASMLSDAGITVTRGEFPVTPVLFNMLPHTETTAALLARKAGHFSLPTDAKVDWEWYLLRRSDGISLEIHYRKARYAAETMEAVANAFLVLLDGAASEPHRAVSDLPLLAGDTLQRILYSWNCTYTPYPRDMLAHELFEQQVARDGDACAVDDGTTTICYRELNTQANRLAHHLRRLGVLPDALVAVCLERSTDLVVGLLAVLKSGGAYVALNPGDPEARLNAMLADCAPVVVLTSSTLNARLNANGAAVLCVDRDAAQWATQPGLNPRRLATPSNLAYVVYTSGTTGRPKGILKEHDGLVNYLAFLRRTCAMVPSDTVLQVANVGFDPLARDVFGPLAVGARLVIPRPHEAIDPRALARLILSERISLLLSVTPSMLAEMCTVSSNAEISGMRCILSSGEVLSESHVAAARRTFGPHLRVINQYGPSEITMIATCHEAPVAGPVSIGRPIDNVAVYILDEGLRPVPVGVAGELHLTGVGLARGYLNLPELTDLRFIPSPFGPPGSRMFRTGDLARFGPDGTIEYLGRKDDQIKISGVRIEIAEVEAAVRQLEGIRAAAVAAHDDGHGGKMLIAYVVMGDPKRPLESMRRALRSTLPDCMIPARFVAMEALPMTANRKLDLRALPAPLKGTHRTGTVSRPPGNPTEQVVARIWSEVLRIEPVDADGDLFELGGSSLQAMRIVARAGQHFGVDIPLRELYHAPTVAGLARAIDSALMISSYLDESPSPGSETTWIEF